MRGDIFGHDDFDRQFDHDWKKARRGFGVGFFAIVILNVLWIGVLTWALIQLVQWVTSK